MSYVDLLLLKKAKDKKEDKKDISIIVKVLLNILKTCKGRDKISTILQYSVKFFSTVIYSRIDINSLYSLQKYIFTSEI